jgi:MFS family permease
VRSLSDNASTFRGDSVRGAGSPSWLTLAQRMPASPRTGSPSDRAPRLESALQSPSPPLDPPATLSQFFQSIQGYSPLGSGVRILPWTIMPLFVAPIAGALSDRIGGHRLMGVGLTLQAVGLASLAAISAPTTPYWQLVAPFVVSGIGMAMFWAPVSNVVLSAVKREEGQASGANNAIRELGGVVGVAVLASVFSSYGGYRTADTFVNGMNAAVAIGAGVVALGAVAAFAIGKSRVRVQEQPVQAEPLAEAA